MQGSPDDKKTEFNLLKEFTEVAPRQAVIDSWELLEYQLNIIAHRLSPEHIHDWPQTVDTLTAWDKWPSLYPAVSELRHLRNLTVRAAGSPSSSDAVRYISIVQDLVTTLKTALVSLPEGTSAIEESG